MKKTKIVATLGPASDSKEMIRQLIEAGMNVARLNFSHGEYSWHEKIINTIRELSQEMNVSVGILADLQGPRIRTLVAEDLVMANGEYILVSDVAKAPNQNFPKVSFQTITQDQIEGAKKLSLDISNIVDDIEVGNEILIEDGLMKLVVMEKNDGVLLTQVVNGGTVKNHKGVNIPDANLQIDPITEKDARDLEFAVKHGVDFVGLSFVSSPENIRDLKNRISAIIEDFKNFPQIVAKIERKEAIKNLEGIVQAVDAIMVARGDLGIEMEDSKVAILQKEIIAAALNQAKPVIVATQMLNSMIENPRPTRAEISDVCNAVIDHTDAVMLSGESANGKYPVESVKKMREIIESTEESSYDDMKDELRLAVKSDYVAIARSAHELAKGFDANAILMTSMSGFTARLVSNFRPNQKLLVATLSEKTYNQLALVWGIQPYLFSESDGNPTRLIEQMIERTKEMGKLKKGDKAVIIAGRTPDGEQMHLIGVKEIE